MLPVKKKKRKQKPMPERMAESFAKMMQRELNSRCPEESMSRYLDDEFRWEITDVKIEDGIFHLYATDTDNDTKRILRLKPVSWSKK